MPCPRRFRHHLELSFPALLVLIAPGAACSVDSGASPASTQDGGASTSDASGSGSASGSGGSGSGGSRAGTGGAAGPRGGSISCPPGTAETTGDGGPPCADVDECAAGLDDCDDDPEATCANMLLSYRCICPPGTHDPAT